MSLAVFACFTQYILLGSIHGAYRRSSLVVDQYMYSQGAAQAIQHWLLFCPQFHSCHAAKQVGANDCCILLLLVQLGRVAVNSQERVKGYTRKGG